MTLQAWSRKIIAEALGADDVAPQHGKCSKWHHLRTINNIDSESVNVMKTLRKKRMIGISYKTFHKIEKIKNYVTFKKLLVSIFLFKLSWDGI